MISIVDKYRPKRLTDIVGQDQAVSVLSRFCAKPYSQAFILYGGSGLGKTAASFAVARELGCDLSPNVYSLGGLHQIAAGEQKADAVRELSGQLARIPMYGSGWKVAIINEADQSSPQAQVVWLDVLENLPPRTVIIFTTNEIRSLSAR